ncbi:MAG: hypothetical protein ABL962_03690 [Fimbriimonadaceae bacterium]
MNWLLGQAPVIDTTFNRPPGSSGLYTMIALTLLIGFGLMFALLKMPSRGRKWIVMAVTFLSGLFYVMLFFWPKAEGRVDGVLPNNTVEAGAFFLEDAVGRIGNVASILTAFLLGLGVFSLLKIHGGKVFKQQKDWIFSLVLLVSMLTMAFVGYLDWINVKFVAPKTDFNIRENWTNINYAKDLLFDGFLQKMDSAMFSVIAFYIISAAYRAFRVRSVEATILLCAALVMMLSLLGLVDLWSNNLINGMTGDDKGHFLNNFKITEIAGFVRASFQQPSIRAIDFGIGVGALAMGLRLWLSLDRTGGTN